MGGAVVFDNNAYKGVSVARLERIIAAERVRDIVALANIIVAQELLARVRDPDEKQRSRNRAAVRKMGLHCRGGTVDVPAINFIAHSDSQIYRMIAGVQHPNDGEMFRHLGEMIGFVSHTANDDALAPLSANLDAIELHVANLQAEYVDGLAKAAAQPVSAQANEMRERFDFASQLVHRAETAYGVAFDPTRVVHALLDVVRLSEIGFSLTKTVVSEIRARGGGHAKHANTGWDVEIVSSTSVAASIDGQPVFVVTEEEQLLDAARAAGAGDRVMNLADFEILLGLPSSPENSASATKPD